jgi:MFS family permease
MSEAVTAAPDAPANQSLARVGFTAWWMVGVLFLLNILAWLDRLVITILAPAIRAELDISTFEMSLVLGPAFAIFYALFGVPIGWAVDRYSRRWIIFLGVLLWALATIASGFARSYEMLLFCRVFVGVGEAVLAPAAVSLIAGAFPKERVTSALAVFQSSSKIGAATAMGAGAFAVSLAVLLLAQHGSILGAEQPWHLVMAMVGAPGLALAFLVFSFREPARKQHNPKEALSTPALFAFLGRRWPLWLGMFVAFNAISILGFGLSQFMPTYLESRFGWRVEQYGYGIMATNLASAASLVVSGWIIDRLYRGGMRDVHLRFYAWLMIAFSPAFLSLFWVTDPRIVLVLYALVQFVTVPFFVFVSSVIVLAAPASARGQLVALYVASFTILGQGVGPPLVGAIAQYGFHADKLEGAAYGVALGQALAIVTLGGILLAFAALQVARRHVGAAYRDDDAAAGARSPSAG